MARAQHGADAPVEDDTGHLHTAATAGAGATALVPCSLSGTVLTAGAALARLSGRPAGRGARRPGARAAAPVHPRAAEARPADPLGGTATGSATLRFRHADGCDVEVPTSRSVLAGASADTTQVVFVRADAPAAAALQDGDRRSTSGTSPSWTCGPGPSSAWRPWLDGCTRSLDNSARVRPADLVGAITGEAGLRGRDVGAIGITQRFSLVEVPVPAADGVVRALRSATIKGRQPVVRRDRGRTG